MAKTTTKRRIQSLTAKLQKYESSMTAWGEPNTANHPYYDFLRIEIKKIKEELAELGKLK